MPARKKKTVEGDPVLVFGRFVNDDGYVSEFVSRLRTKRGSIVVKPTFGSRIHEIKKATSDAAKLSEKLALLAVTPMVDQRKIRDVTITSKVARMPGAGAYFEMECSYYTRSGRKQTVNYQHRLGS